MVGAEEGLMGETVCLEGGIEGGKGEGKGEGGGGRFM